MTNHVATAASAVQAPAKPGGIFAAAGAIQIPIICILLLASALSAQVPIPDWCRALPRPEYKTLERVPVSDPWFEVYKPAPDIFATYEPHQAEETIGYLIVGRKQALLFDIGMGISDMKKVTAELTKLPIIALNSHTHDDHVGGNWQFATVYAMDTDFTRKNALGSHEDAQAEITPDQICGSLPKGFNSKDYATRPWKITAYTHDGERFDLGSPLWKSSLHPAILPTPFHSSTAPMVCSSPGTLTIRPPSGSSGPKQTSKRTPRR